jgi:hypothetical protein
LGRRRKGNRKGAARKGLQEPAQSTDSTGPIEDETTQELPEPAPEAAPEAPKTGHPSDPPPAGSASSILESLMSTTEEGQPAWGRQDSMAGIDLERLRPSTTAPSPDKTNPLTFVPRLVKDPAERARIEAETVAKGGTVLRSPEEEVARAEAVTTEHRAVAPYAAAYAPAPIIGPKATIPLPSPVFPPPAPVTPTLPEFGDDEPDTAEVVVPSDISTGDRPTTVTDISEVVAAHERKEQAAAEAAVNPAEPAPAPKRTLQLPPMVIPPIMTTPPARKGDEPDRKMLGQEHLAALVANMPATATLAPAEEKTAIYDTTKARARIPTAQLPFAPTALPPPPAATVAIPAPLPAREEPLPGMFDGDDSFPEATTEYHEPEKALPPAKPRPRLEDVVGKAARPPVPPVATKPIDGEDFRAAEIAHARKSVPPPAPDYVPSLAAAPDAAPSPSTATAYSASEEKASEAEQEAPKRGALYSFRRAWFPTDAEKMEDFARSVERQRQKAEEYVQTTQRSGAGKKIAVGVVAGLAILGGAIGLYYLLSKPSEESKQDTQRDAQVAMVEEAHDAAYDSHTQELDDIVEQPSLGPDSKDAHTPALPTPPVGPSPEPNPDENPDQTQTSPQPNQPEQPSIHPVPLPQNWEDRCRWAAYDHIKAAINSGNPRSNNPDYNLSADGKDPASHQGVINTAYREGSNVQHAYDGNWSDANSWTKDMTGHNLWDFTGARSGDNVRGDEFTPDDIDPAKVNPAVVPECARDYNPEQPERVSAAETPAEDGQTAQSAPTQHLAKVILSPDLQSEVDAYNAAHSTAGNNSGNTSPETPDLQARTDEQETISNDGNDSGNTSPELLPHYNDIQRTAISELYARHTFGKDITWQQVLGQAAQFGVEGLTLELAKESYFEQRTAQEDETALVVLPRPSAQQQPQEARVDIQWSAECYNGMDKDTIRDLYTRFYGQDVSPEEFQEAAKAYGIEGLTLEVAKQVFDESKSADGKIVLDQLPIDNLYFEPAPERHTVPGDDAYKLVHDLNEQGYEFEDIQRIARLRGLNVTRDNFEYVKTFGKLDTMMEEAPTMSPVEQALAEIIPGYTPTAAPAEPPVIRIRNIIVGDEAYNPQPVTVTKHIMLNEPQPEATSAPVKNKWREIDAGWDDILAEMDRPEPVVAAIPARSKLDDIDAGWDDILAEMDEPEQKYAPEMRYAA